MSWSRCTNVADAMRAERMGQRHRRRIPVTSLLHRVPTAGLFLATDSADSLKYARREAVHALHLARHRLMGSVAVERAHVLAQGQPHDPRRFRPHDTDALNEAIRDIPPQWFKAAPWVYWFDFVVSTTVGWTAFAAAVARRGTSRIVLLLVATAALYRAVLFIHEITHRAGREVPWFRFAWNVLVGVPLLLPSFLYEGVHNDHHRQHCYGTVADPEYLPYARRRRLFIVGSVAAAAAAPVALFVRFAFIAPVGWIAPSIRRIVHARLSALVINPLYVRHDSLPARAYVQEAAAFSFLWTMIGLCLAGILPIAAIGCWMCATATAFVTNAVRTLAAHRYDNEASQLSMVEQLLDSYTVVAGPTALRVLVGLGHAILAPVGLRFHSLHHWIPSLPYHRLGRVHRRLTTTLRADAPYRSTVHRGFAPVIHDLFRRASRHA